MALRQQILVLWLANGDLGSTVCAWTSYDAAGSGGKGPGDCEREESGDAVLPPYPSALAAMRAGWRLIQFPVLSIPPPGAEHATGALKHQCVLERLVEADAGASHG